MQSVSVFWQVLLFRKWRPDYGRGFQAAFFMLCAVFFIVLGAMVISANGEVVVVKAYYSNESELSLTVPSLMSPPVYVMYELENFHQNNRIYSQSKSNKQLMGAVLTPDQARKECGQESYLNSQFIAQGYQTTWAGKPLDPTAVASPCGLVAKSFFNDTYQLRNPQGALVQINETGISWKGDQGNKFRMSNDSEATQWINPENEHFINWMRTAALPNFQKLWGRIYGPLQPGNYSVQIANHYNISRYGGKKAIVLSTVSEFGGRNSFEGWAILSVGLLNAFLSLVNFFFCYRQSRYA